MKSLLSRELDFNEEGQGCTHTVSMEEYTEPQSYILYGARAGLAGSITHQQAPAENPHQWKRRTCAVYVLGI